MVRPRRHDHRRYLATLFNLRGIDVFRLLIAIGRDCPGALQFAPEGFDLGIVGTIDVYGLTDREIRKSIVKLSTSPLGNTAETMSGLTLAGSRQKMALLYAKISRGYTTCN